MRADMFKLIVERPRVGRSRAQAVKLDLDPDWDRKGVGLKRHVCERATNRKSLNENLAPLVRYLRKQRGRPWDDVFSEICAGLDTASTVKLHVRDHLKDFVLFGISTGRHGELIHNGHVLQPGYRGWRRGQFYVDPVDGILKDHRKFWAERGQAVPSRCFSWFRANQTARCIDLRWIGPAELVLKHNGMWFGYRLDTRPRIGDHALLGILRDRQWDEQEGWTVLAFGQLAKRDLKRHGLRNDAESGQ